MTQLQVLVKTSELKGEALNWAVVKARGVTHRTPDDLHTGVYQLGYPRSKEQARRHQEIFQQLGNI